MNIDMRLHQGTNLSQQLNLAPQLLNWLRLLQCPTTDLATMVSNEMAMNPALEADEAQKEDDVKAEDDDWGDMPSNDEATSIDEDLAAKMDFLSEVENEWRYDQHDVSGASKSEQSEKHQYIMDSIIAGESLQEHLLQQISTLQLSEDDRMLVEFLIGSIDERGYLIGSLDELVEMTGISLEHAEHLLHQVQGMDPAGIGARDLAECLVLQMEDPEGEQKIAATLITEHTQELADRDVAFMADELGVTEEEVEQAIDTITGLDPTPGTQFGGRPIEYVTPDVTVYENEGKLVVEVNDQPIPRLRISTAFKALLSQKTLTADDKSYIREKMRSASFLIQGIGQRQETLNRVTEEILRVQKDFFTSEEGTLRPLTMAKVASVIGVHETTVSRALASKYIRTPRGIFEMKHFFQSGYLCHDGTSITPDTVKTKIKKLITREDETAPLTDLDIVEALQKDGLNLARRTVAKYRDEMGILASKQRKRKTSRKAAGVVRVSERMTPRKTRKAKVLQMPERKDTVEPDTTWAEKAKVSTRPSLPSNIPAAS
jgi:RNA polymerase sigma-54 factor